MFGGLPDTESIASDQDSNKLNETLRPNKRESFNDATSDDYQQRKIYSTNNHRDTASALSDLQKSTLS